MTNLSNVSNPAYSLYHELEKTLEAHGFRLDNKSGTTGVPHHFTVLSYRSPLSALTVAFSPYRETGGVQVEMGSRLRPDQHQETVNPEDPLEEILTRLELTINKHIT